jgi:16S rRNA C1402 (ribose-2'-O) methylase RsmI
LAERFHEPPRGEITLVLGPAAKRAEPDEAGAQAAEAAVADLVAGGIPRRAAADLVARLTGISRNRLYRGSL